MQMLHKYICARTHTHTHKHTWSSIRGTADHARSTSWTTE